ncbi:hypothetical protein Y032_0026g1320 [Ancylostoma ceylanicum]|uniref:Uncharacterized protein n=1 Tax=Ancylostoma ceylanicum TaxID=53326 RepID=A0A016UTE8_9BILA|nr:hypothetical protein Y032_0026g1320 [Ancylostoma ceylanicum]
MKIFERVLDRGLRDIVEVKRRVVVTTMYTYRLGSPLRRRPVSTGSEVGSGKSKNPSVNDRKSSKLAECSSVKECLSDRERC